MFNLKLTSLLKTFSVEEFSEFEKFVKSPVHNIGRNYSRFAAELKKNHPDFNNSNFTKEKLWGKLYAGKKYNDKLMNNIIYRTTRMAEEYLSWLTFRKNKFENKKLYIRELMQRKLYKLVRTELAEMQNMFDKEWDLSEDMVDYKLEYSILNVQFCYQLNKQNEAMPFILDQSRYLVYHFLIRAACFLHDIKVNKNIYNLDLSDSIALNFFKQVNIEELLDNLDKSKDEPVVHDFIKIILLWIGCNIHETDKNYYDKFKVLMYESISKFNHSTKYTLYQAFEAIVWFRMISVDREKYRKEFFDVYKHRIENGVFSYEPNQSMRTMLYRMIVVNGLAVKEYNWVKNFIENYTNYLPEEHRNNMNCFAMALLSFEMNDFEKALEFVGKVNYELFVFKYDIKLLLLKIFYEKNCYEEALSLIDSFKHFLSGNKTVSEYYRNNYMLFLKYYKELLNMKIHNSTEDSEMLKNKINSEKNLISKTWLLEKITLTA
jgi:hypothetical protein